MLNRDDAKRIIIRLTSLHDDAIIHDDILNILSDHLAAADVDNNTATYTLPGGAPEKGSLYEAVLQILQNVMKHSLSDVRSACSRLITMMKRALKGDTSHPTRTPPSAGRPSSSKGFKRKRQVTTNTTTVIDHRRSIENDVDSYAYEYEDKLAANLEADAISANMAAGADLDASDDERAVDVETERAAAAEKERAAAVETEQDSEAAQISSDNDSDRVDPDEIYDNKDALTIDELLNAPDYS